MHADGLKDILEEVPGGIRWRQAFMQGVAEHLVSLTRDGELDLATPANPNTLYNPIMKSLSHCRLISNAIAPITG